jgi:hypothetical protein
LQYYEPEISEELGEPAIKTYFEEFMLTIGAAKIPYEWYSAVYIIYIFG